MAALYTPIVTPGQVLHAIGAGKTETLYVEYKSDIRPGGHRETALDVAAFANQWGGSLLFGVSEQPSGAAHDASGIRDFDKVREHVEEARKNHCRPSPNVQCERLDVSGKVILVLNVPPDDRLIAVPKGNAIEYPFRTNHGKSYMPAEQVVERATPSSRLGEIKLHRALGKHGQISQASDGGLRPPECQVHLTACYEATHVTSTTERVNRVRPLSVCVERMDDYQFCLRIVLNEDQVKNGNPDQVWIPYGLVREAWPMSDGIGLALNGRLVYARGWFLET